MVQIELLFDKDKACFPFRILHKLWTIACKRYFLTATDKRNGTDGFVGIIGKNTAIISDSSELPKMSLLLLVKFVCVGNLTDRTHDKLSGKMICFLDGIIDFFVQIELLEHMTFPRYLRDSVTSLIENTECLFQHNGLFVGWKQPNLQSQFHITKIQNSFDILKYLKEIIMLNELQLDPAMLRAARKYGYTGQPYPSALAAWLRDKYGMFVVVTPDAYTTGVNWEVQVLSYNPEDPTCWDADMSSGVFGDNAEFATYEQALLFGLSHAFKLLSVHRKA